MQALQLAIQLLCVDKAEGVCLDGDLMDVIADGGELPHRIIETVVGFFLWLIATEQQTDECRFREAGFLGFLLQVLCFVTGKPKLLLDRSFPKWTSSFLLKYVCFLHGVLGVPPNEDFLRRFEKRSKKALLVKIIQSVQGNPVIVEISVLCPP